MGDGMTVFARRSGGRILCIRLSGLGDVVHALNALSLLRQERPDAHIVWAVEDRFSGLLRDHPYIDELIAVPRAAWARMSRNPFRWGELGGELYALASRLREGAFDASVDFQSSLKSSWLAWAARAPLRIGFARPVSRELNRLVQTDLVTSPAAGVHRIERNLALLAPLGIPTRYAAPIVPVDGPECEAVREELGRRLTGRPVVAVHPGTSAFAAFKRWPPERYAAVADALVESRQLDVVVTYGPSDRELAERVVALMQQPGVLAPATASVRGLAAVVAGADLFIGSDSGPLHVASALGVPCVALFGPKEPVQTGPYCSRSIAVTGSAPCRPCRRRRCRDPVCMTSITCRAVVDAAVGVLDGGGQRRAADGMLRKGFARAFELGRWRGRCDTAYSAPAFFDWLSDCTALTEEALSDPPRAVDGTAPPAGEVLLSAEARRRLLIDRPAGGGGAARRWWRAVSRRRPELPVPWPVCYAELGRGRRAPAIAVVEEPAGIPLPQWLRGPGARRDASGRAALVRALLEAVSGLHRRGYRHADLTPARAFVRSAAAAGTDGVVEILLAGTRLRWAGWLPAPWRSFVFGLDLGTLALGLRGLWSDEEEAALLAGYRARAVADGQSVRMLDAGLKHGKEADSWVKRFL
jgi:lipopolysaccharide heptosyltransferase I